MAVSTQTAKQLLYLSAGELLRLTSAGETSAREVVDALKQSGHWQEGGTIEGTAAAPAGAAQTR